MHMNADVHDNNRRTKKGTKPDRFFAKI